jgi:hypothetical protein
MSNILRVAKYMTWRHEELAGYYDDLETAIKEHDKWAADDAVKDIVKWYANGNIAGKFALLRKEAMSIRPRKRRISQKGIDLNAHLANSGTGFDKQED